MVRHHKKKKKSQQNNKSKSQTDIEAKLSKLDELFADDEDDTQTTKASKQNIITKTTAASSAFESSKRTNDEKGSKASKQKLTKKTTAASPLGTDGKGSKGSKVVTKKDEEDNEDSDSDSDSDSDDNETQSSLVDQDAAVDDDDESDDDESDNAESDDGTSDNGDDDAVSSNKDSDDDEDNTDNDDDDDNDDELNPDLFAEPSSSSKISTNRSAKSMADVMSRLLSAGKPKDTPDAVADTKTTKQPPKPSPTTSIVLSKTTTKLQKQQKALKETQILLTAKRAQRRAENLVALSMNENNVVKERQLRKVATRGVVALFNAIAKHQFQEEEVENETIVEKKKKEGTGGLNSKHDFLNMVRGAAGTTKPTTSSKIAETETAEPVQKAPKWDAFKEDYLMSKSNKLKDWDKDDEDDSLSSDSDDDDDDDSRLVSKRKHDSNTSQKKRLRTWYKFNITNESPTKPRE